MHIFSIFVILLRSGFCDKLGVNLGSDVSLRCEVSLLSESSTLQWEKDRGQTSNTTLIYNNTAYIILHSVDEHSEGDYYCKLRKDGGEETVKVHTLNVKTNSYTENNKNNNIIYRKSSNNSEVLLTCKSQKIYESWKWTWEQSNNSQFDLMTVEKAGQVQVKGPIKTGKHSSTKYNSQAFNFHISPVKFSYSGKYRCITETTTYTTIILHTIRVSVEPPVGEWRNQSVVLTCEVSEVTDPVMLFWLRMEGNRGVLEKQQIMNEKNKKLQLTVDLSSYETQSLHWKCAVFTENELRALGPVTINLSISIENSTATNQQENMDLQDGHPQTVIIMASAVSVSVMILLGFLVCKCQRNTDKGPVNGLKSQNEEDIHYASITAAEFSQVGRIQTNRSSPEMLDRNSPVIYSTIKTH